VSAPRKRSSIRFAPRAGQ